MTRRITGGRTGFLLGLLLLLGTPSTSAGGNDLLARVARDLAERPWTLRVSVEASEQPGASGLVTAVRTSSMRVTYDPGKSVTLALGALRVRAEPGLLTAVHTGNRSAVYRAEHPGRSIADVLGAELPPLWCPWLAVALTGDPDAWPLVGGPTPGVRWSPTPQTDDTGEPVVIRGLRRDGNARLEAEVIPNPPGPPFLRRYTVEIPRDGRTLRFLFSAERAAPVAIPPDPPAGRTPVDSLAALMPAPPPLHPGDRIPPVRLTAFNDESLAAGSFQPAEVFKDRDDPGRPTALVLVLTRTGPDTPGRLARIAGMIHPARLRSGVTGVLARPAIAVNTEETNIAALAPLRRAWRSAYSPDITIPNTETDIPGTAWTPDSVLLDRVAPEQDTALVVIDRSGWIVGVLDEAATEDQLADALRAAAR